MARKDQEDQQKTLQGRLLETLKALMPVGLFTVDEKGRMTRWNPQMEALTGYSAGEALGQPCSLLASTADEPCRPGLPGCALVRGEGILGKRILIRTRDGNTILVLKNARAMRDENGRVLGVVQVVTDLHPIEHLGNELVRLRCLALGRSAGCRLVGHHPSMEVLQRHIELAARTSSSVLIQGETGTGKELVARAIHEASDRREGPFGRVSCAALSESLLESELFGHVRGAFTGAIQNRTGRFEAAHGGTIFLDEIGDVPPMVQVKLLRVLQEREFERVGETRPVRVDIRVIAATNRDLQALAENGGFRRDLYYRLAVLPIHVPALRERASDIPLLVQHFIERFNPIFGRKVVGVSQRILSRLVQYSWPGNVRQLENAIEYAFVMSRGEWLEDGHFPSEICQDIPLLRSSSRPGPSDADRVVEALRASGGNRTEAARRLGIHRITLWKWMRRLGLEQADALGRGSHVADGNMRQP
ncbi:MAG TPA: sigma 54-interacting transcriptional regulator [Myxococcota bacterium]|nr:sigma 54-interacting transcriptional regulator [Myxococcota bacterium]HQK52114.1 sigma 54-interacting transcriptional regulator [Myxococcota bacterium]